MSKASIVGMQHDNLRELGTTPEVGGCSPSAPLWAAILEALARLSSEFGAKYAGPKFGPTFINSSANPGVTRLPWQGCYLHAHRTNRQRMHPGYSDSISECCRRPVLHSRTVSMYFFLPTKFFFRQFGRFFAKWGLFFAKWGLFFANFFDHARYLYSEPSASD